MLPPDMMNGSYELRDLDHATVGQLYEGKLVIDKTYGHAAYGCGSCCGYSTVVFGPNRFSGPPGNNFSDFIHATQQCGGYIDVVTHRVRLGQQQHRSRDASEFDLAHGRHRTGDGGVKALLKSNHPEPSGNCQTRTFTPQQSLKVVSVVVSIQSSGTAATDNAAGRAL